MGAPFMRFHRMSGRSPKRDPFSLNATNHPKSASYKNTLQKPGKIPCQAPKSNNRNKTNNIIIAKELSRIHYN
jgi:hypothetical protein